MIWIVLAVVAAMLLIMLWIVRQLNALRARVEATPADGNVFAMLRRVDAEIAHLDRSVRAMEPRLSSVEARIPHAMSHTGTVTYDAFDNIAGNQSRSIAVLSESGDGLVMSLLVGRNETLFFTKEVRDSVGVEELSPEEQEAVAQAMRRSQ